MAVSKRAKAIYNCFFDGIETAAANFITNVQEEHYLRKYLDKSHRLTAEQKREIRKFWAPYCCVSSKWAQYYSAKNGLFDPRYIPNTICYTKIDQHFNKRKLGYGFNDKNYYSKIFDGIRQPHVIVRKINGFLLDEQYNKISMQEAKEKILQHIEVICKPSQESGSGRGIFFLSQSNTDMVNDFLSLREYDNYVVQELVIQHPDLAKIHKDSLNCIRICSILFEDGVYILSSVLRMGFGKSKVDNATAKGNSDFDGTSCGIDENGKLKKYAYGYYKGERMEKHPDGVVFEGYPIPSFDKAVALVKECHPRIPNFRLVSWDVAIDYDGNPVLIEANMRKGGINILQFNNGPMFGDLTERVLNEVFLNKD